MLVIGDIHIKNKYHERSITLVDDIIQNVKRLEPDSVMLLGDVLDGADIIHSNCLFQLSRLLTEIRVFCPVYVIMGNHDASTPHIEMPENHALQCFKTLVDRNIHIVDKPTEVDPGYGSKILITPYLPPGTFMKNIAKHTDIKLVFAHQEFEGCVFDGGNKSEKGDVIPDGFAIISGHIHAEQRIKNLWYPGTPTQTRFGESDDKGYFLIEIDDVTLRYKVIEKIIPNVSKFISIPYKIGQCIKDIGINVNNVNRAVITATPSEILSFKKSKEYLGVIDLFTGNVKFNVLKEGDSRSAQRQTNDSTQRRSFIDTLTSKAKEIGLIELLNDSLNK
jgi:DNA repair exonuclease SbcCD nuclease subunit